MGLPLSPLHKANSSRKAQKIVSNHGLLMDLPSHVMVEILSRLPAKSRARTGLVVHQSEMLKKFFRLVDFEDASDHHNLGYDSMVKFNLSPLSTYPDANIVVDGSVDGFLFLHDINYKHETLYICNPLTREYIELPRPEGIVRYPNVVTHGFGVTQMSGEYKVVRIFHERELHPRTRSCIGVPQSECQVYTLGTGAWRSIGAVPFAYDSRLIGLFFRGNLHWLIQDLEGYELISCFDLENEMFQPFPPPFPGRKLLGSLGVLKGCLCLCDNTSYFEIDIWVMKEYGVEKSWGKEFVIRKITELVGPTREIVHVLEVFGDGNILLMWGDYCMLHYCSKSNVTEEVDMEQPRGPNCIEAMHYVPSFHNLGSFSMEKVITF